MEAVTLDPGPEGVREGRSRDLTFHHEGARPRAHGFAALAPVLVERDDFQTPLAQATIVVTAAGRKEPPVYSTVLACDHTRALVAGAWKLGAMPPLHNRPDEALARAQRYLLGSLTGDPSWSRLPCRRSVPGKTSTSSSARPLRR